MRLFVPKELTDRETRAAITPDTARKLAALGLEVAFESGVGVKADFVDAAYKQVGATLQDRGGGIAGADIIFRVTPPPVEEIRQMKPGSVYVGFLSPFENKEGLAALAAQGVTAVCLEMMPRTTLAQKMDAISSQANLAGYAAVVLGASRMTKIFPMMMTPAGTISPSKVFVIGVGVAGLQAIATAKRLGARVTAFDSRPEAQEQAESLGAKALRIDLGQTGSTEQGYAKELTPEQIEKQRVEQGKVCAQSDLVITTAKLFGKKAPLLVKKDVIDQMMPGSILVDLAVETGGNVEGSRLDEEVITENGVRIIGYGKLENFVPRDASQMYGHNLYNFIEHFWDKTAKTLRIDLTDEIQKGCVLTHGGAIVHERFKS